MIEVKLSQGAKPGHGGVLQGAKVTQEVADVRGVAPGVDCVSPAKHSAFSTPVGLLEFVDKLRQLSGGKPTVTDGPFIETKEVLGGYWMIRVNSKEEAIAWASRCPMADNEIIEIRQVQEMSDFPPDVQKAAEGFSEMQQGQP